MRIGTRGSALALAQATPLAETLGGELVVITTAGDRDRAAGDKGRWVGELERALLDGEIDLAIHSAKDVPAELAAGTELLGSPPRADPRDALCGAASLDTLAEGARVGTASLRREAQLRALRPDLDVAELRGNVDTRLRRLAAGDFDAIVLAAAGLERLGRGGEGVPLDQLVPAAGQGVLALQVRAGERFDVASDEATTLALQCERALVRALEADCDTPVGAFAEVGAGGELTLSAFVGRADGSAWIRDEHTGSDPSSLGAEVGARLLAAGAAEILGR
ncbi:MAG: hydroxymethylbilane synthase [Solirubrobacteraceae bacterium]|nr:hydroxymethylbilane synthase [Solirubrobacteraceae bacterium]